MNPNESGWLKLHRGIEESSVFGDSATLHVWIWCLVRAAHRPRKVLIGSREVELKAGQFITGRDSAEARLPMSGKTVYRRLAMLEKMGNLSIKKTTKFSIITVEKWATYQQPVPQVSRKCPASVPQVSTNKNDKKGRIKETYGVDKKITNVRPLPPARRKSEPEHIGGTLAEVGKRLRERGIIRKKE